MTDFELMGAALDEARKARSVWPGCALHMINNCLVFAARLAERGMG